MTTIALAAGQVVSGPQFSEPMRVETVQSSGAGIWTGAREPVVLNEATWLEIRKRIEEFA